MAHASPEMEKYFVQLREELDKAYKIATRARKKGMDPEDYVDVRLAENMAERVEGLISDVAPQLVGTGMTNRIYELEEKYGKGAWQIALIIAKEIAQEKYCSFEDKREAMEVGIRAGFSYITNGLVSAPLEGFTELVIKKRGDGKEYLSLKYSGPVRGAGGTGASVSVLIADYVRKEMGYAPYDPTEKEVSRYVTEIKDYHERVTNLQYLPSDDEVRFLASHIPVEISGDPTEKFEVSNYKDLPRVETNRIRGGVCLVMAEGLAQKSPKLWGRLSKWGKDFGLQWDFLEEFLTLQKRMKAKQKGNVKIETAKLTPNHTFIADLVAGRPVLTHPMRKRGFRLRYGRSRISGFSAASIHPATMQLLDGYIATGTQLKVERPGKAAAITPCDSIDGPIVRLKDGGVRILQSEADYKEVKGEVEHIIFLGDILFNYGDFAVNNHKLIPSGYCEEWWVQEIERATVDMFGSLDYEKLSDLVDIPPESLSTLMRSPYRTKISANAAISVSQKLKVPFHPKHTFYWSTIDVSDLKKLFPWVQGMRVHREGEKVTHGTLPLMQEEKRVLELLGVPHMVVLKEHVRLEKDVALALLANLGILDRSSAEEKGRILEEYEGTDTLEAVNKISSVFIRDRAGTFIGARMGRPEKAKMRKLTGSPHVLFPVSEEGGRLRSFQAALEEGKITAEIIQYRCTKCGKTTHYPSCCGRRAEKSGVCQVCGFVGDECPRHGETKSYKQTEIDIRKMFNDALAKLDMHLYPDLIKGVRGTSNKDHIPENIAKGILRAKHEIYVNKDGTTRYDMSELPVTHFKPSEVGTSVEKLNEMGYTKDIHGKDLTDKDQILELKAQDVILPDCQGTLDEMSSDVLSRIAAFVDDLLVRFYDLEPYYNIGSKEDLVGHLVIGLAPHTSAGILGRIVGFSKTQGCFAHPLWHSAMRRDCDGDENCVILLMDALLNFSRQFLPDKRGSRTMDAPLVLTCKLIPSEVDDMVFGMDVVWKYDLSFYDAAMSYKSPYDIKISQLGDFLDTERQYEGLGFTMPVTSMNLGTTVSSYKTLPSMEEKLKGQMALAEKISAVDEADVARLVIEKHFLKDTKGNLRKFSMQQFRCVKCNSKYRRPPLIGRCPNCNGKIIFTISEGSVVKYLEPSISLAEKYNVHPYLQQSLELLKRRYEAVFGKDKEKQVGLGSWF